MPKTATNGEITIFTLPAGNAFKMKKHLPVQNMTNFKRLMLNHRFPLLWEHRLPFFVEPNQYGAFLHFPPTVFGTVS